MKRQETNAKDAKEVALAALVWILQDDARATRLLAITGLEPDDLRARVGDPVLLDAVLAFLEAHEPDLIACAHAIDASPIELIAARARLAG